MGAYPTKAADNVYCRSRKTAAARNKRLSSREGAAELLGLSVSTLADYELGITKVIPVTSVVRMADLYNAPELLNDYCVNQCPIGCRNTPKLEIADLDRLTVKILAALNKGATIKDILLQITEDGIIEECEEPDLLKIIEYFDSLAKTGAELRLWAVKNNIRGDSNACKHSFL